MVGCCVLRPPREVSHDESLARKPPP
jgi:hypothetical protein